MGFLVTLQISRDVVIVATWDGDADTSSEELNLSKPRITSHLGLVDHCEEGKRPLLLAKCLVGAQSLS